MGFIENILGIHVRYKKEEVSLSLPSYLRSRYVMNEAELCDTKAVFVRPKEELDPVDTLKKHLNQIEQAFGAKAVLTLERITYREREYLLREHIPFVAEGKQLYLPFLAVYLQKRCDIDTQKKEMLTPAAQVLLLYYIYQGCGEFMTSEAAKALAFTSMTISRASKELVEHGFVKAKRKGVEKVLFCDINPRELFLQAGSSFLNPVKRTVYVPKTEVGNDVLLGGYSALSASTMMSSPAVSCYVSGSVSKWGKVASPTLQDRSDQCAMELWRYDPKRLSTGGFVDPLSLALSLRDDQDERVEEAVEELLKQVWGDIDGTRD